MEYPSCIGEAVSIKRQSTCNLQQTGYKMQTETKTTCATLSLIIIFVIYFHGIFHSTVASIPILNADLITIKSHKLFSVHQICMLYFRVCDSILSPITFHFADLLYFKSEGVITW